MFQSKRITTDELLASEEIITPMDIYSPGILVELENGTRGMTCESNNRLEGHPLGVTPLGFENYGYDYYTADGHHALGVPRYSIKGAVASK